MKISVSVVWWNYLIFKDIVIYVCIWSMKCVYYVVFVIIWVMRFLCGFKNIEIVCKIIIF